MQTTLDEEKKASLKDTGIRLLFVILFAAIYTVAELVIAALVILQFGFKLVTGETNEKLQDFSRSMNKFVYQILQFVTFNSDDKPFPFDEWPSSDEQDQ